jgi:A/G-specific adenine glycosylase
VVVRADGAVLLRTRAPKGLLGGMTEVPTSEWSADFSADDALASAPRLGKARPKWQKLPGVVTHVFTHFPLELTVCTAEVGEGTLAPEGTRFVARRKLAGEALPNVMRKVLIHARAMPDKPRS